MLEKRNVSQQPYTRKKCIKQNLNKQKTKQTKKLDLKKNKQNK